MQLRFAAVLCLSMLAAPAIAAEYAIDPAHTSVSFKIRHLVTKVVGKFDKFKGTIDYDKDSPEKSKVNATIEANSINTNEPKRDKHLRSGDFFDVEKYKELTFVSKEVTDVKDKTMKVKGDLTIHGVTKPVVLEVEMTGAGTDPWGNQAIGFTGTTRVNRKDFGLNWNKAIEAGGFLVGDDVDIILEVEAHATQPAKKAKK